MTNIKKQNRQRRHQRIRAKVKGTAQRPRLSVFRSNQHVYAQLIDDTKGKVLASSNDLEIKSKGARKRKVELAREVGMAIAKKSLEKKIKKIVFDRGGYKYHGIIKMIAEGAKEGGLQF